MDVEDDDSDDSEDSIWEMKHRMNADYVPPGSIQQTLEDSPSASQEIQKKEIIDENKQDCHYPQVCLRMLNQMNQI